MKNLLLVSNQNMITQLLLLKIDKENFTLHTASNATEARKIVAEQSIDLCLIDLNIPKAEGFEFLSYIKIYKNGSIPSLLLAEQAISNYVQQHLANGNVYVSFKPLKIPIIMDMIDLILMDSTQFLPESNKTISVTTTYTEEGNIMIIKDELTVEENETTQNSLRTFNFN